MAYLKLEIETPAVPTIVRAKMAGRERGITVPVTELSDHDCDALGAAWTLELKRRASGKGGDDADAV